MEETKANEKAMSNNQFTHPIRTDLREDSYFAFIRRAKIDGLADKSGYVDVDTVLRALIDSYGSGDYVILPPKISKLFEVISFKSAKNTTVGHITDKIKAFSKEEAIHLFAQKHQVLEDTCKIVEEAKDGR